MSSKLSGNSLQHPLTHMDSSNEFYSKAGENFFDADLARYRNLVHD
jgi:hypothetical protein